MATQADNQYAVDYFKRYTQYGEEVRYIFRVDIFAPLAVSIKNNSIKNETKKRKGAKRIMALSSFRMLLIKRGPFKGKKVTKNIHLYDLHEIKCTDRNTATFLFRGLHANKSIEMKSGKIAEIIQTIRMLYNTITTGYSSIATMKLDIIPECLLPVSEETMEDNTANGLLFLYRAQSAYFTTRVSTELVHYTEDQVAFDNQWIEAKENPEWLYTNNNPLNYHPFTFELDRIPGIIRNTQLSFTLPPIAAALRHNTYFRALRLCNVQNLKDMILLVANIIRHNQTLTRLDLINLGASKYFLSLGDMLRDNQHHSIQYLSLSGSTIDNTGMLSIAVALEKFRHVLKGLDLSNCGISGKRAEILMNAFCRNYAMSIAIEELNLSNNKFDTNSSKAFEKWLFEAKEFSFLRKLKLASSNLNMVAVTRSFRSLRHLQVLNISGNKLEVGSVELLCVAIDDSHTLKRLNVASCSLKAPLIQKISAALLGNRSLQDVTLDISNNTCSSKSAPQLAEAFKQGHNLHTLKFCGYKWKPEALVVLLRVLARKRRLDTLILDGSCRKTSTGSEELARALALTLKHTTSLRALSLCSGFDKVICEFLEKLQKNTTLLELAIERNHLGDKGAYEIAEMLRLNGTLMLLKCDNNAIGLNGWKSILLSFEMNQTLVHLPYPWKDLQQSLSSGSTANQEHLKEILDRVEHEVNTNSNSEERNYTLIDGTTIHVPPKVVESLPTIPEHLKYLQTEAQKQFEEQQVYWMVNDLYNSPSVEGEDNGGIVGDSDDMDTDTGMWDPFADNFHLASNVDSPYSSQPSTPTIQRPSTPIPLPPNRGAPPSSLLESLGSVPPRPIPTPPPSLDSFQ